MNNTNLTIHNNELQHTAKKDDINGKVVRSIGKTAVGSLDLMISVDSKFDIIRNMEKILKDAAKIKMTDEKEVAKEVVKKEAPVEVLAAKTDKVTKK